MRLPRFAAATPSWAICKMAFIGLLFSDLSLPTPSTNSDTSTVT
jgi:hypothetical protein